jgi:hypothetical protein
VLLSLPARVSGPFCVLLPASAQALLLHGNKWSLIAALYMPWREPLDLRTACHSKTTAVFASRNKLVQQGRTLDWLLSHSTAEYKALWDYYNSHMAAAMAQVRSCPRCSFLQG